MVDRETTLTFDELVGLPLFEQYVTISCVSNEVGGDLVGNAKWTGVRLRDVLELAGVQAGATQLVGRSVDGWTAGMPTAWVMDPAREPMIAVKMNDVPLPPAHGYPARLIVPGLYGYVSATKWLAELELTTLEGFDGYWIPRGWSKQAPILTQSRIDTPLYGAGLATGRVPVAGIAWAPDRGVTRVEVGIDDTWHDAQLSHPISDATWVQWVVLLGRHPGRAPRPGPGDRWHGRDPDRVPNAAGSRRRTRLAHDPGQDRLTARPRFRYRVGVWHDVASSSIHRSASSRAPSVNPAIGRSSSRPGRAAAS